jgi:hypothetical protein
MCEKEEEKEGEEKMKTTSVEEVIVERCRSLKKKRKSSWVVSSATWQMRRSDMGFVPRR